MTKIKYNFKNKEQSTHPICCMLTKTELNQLTKYCNSNKMIVSDVVREALHKIKAIK